MERHREEGGVACRAAVEARSETPFFKLAVLRSLEAIGFRVLGFGKQ